MGTFLSDLKLYTSLSLFFFFKALFVNDNALFSKKSQNVIVNQAE